VIGLAEVRAALFLIGGFEETEAICTVDILRRAGIDVTTVSLGESKRLTGRSGVTVEADAMFADVRNSAFDALVIPGGTTAYMDHEGLVGMVKAQNARGGRLAAICAAPCVLGKAGVLKGKRAVIYPGMEDMIADAAPGSGIVETDGNITTSKGPGTAVYFALRIVEELSGKKIAGEVADKFLVEKITA
jgi:4-methyl-5(b-hydroxyethyl)-thiazole monophosphate biosynthesis